MVFVKHIGEPLTLLAPVEIDAPRVFFSGSEPMDTLVVSACSERCWIVPLNWKFLVNHTPSSVRTSFSRLSEIGITLQRNVDSRTGINDALVQDGHLAGTVIYRIVGALF